MPDAKYDAIVIGGGNKGLVAAMYLAKYGGMKVAVFEKRHELGGGWSSEEGAAPGFISDTHASQLGDFYKTVLDEDFNFPEFGAKWIPYEVAGGAIFREDHSSLCIYGSHFDPTQEKTAKSISRFSEKDAETWFNFSRMFNEKLYDAYLEYHYNPPAPWDTPDPLERAVAEIKEIHPSWAVMSGLQVLKDMFESDAVIATLLRMAHAAMPASPTLSGMGLYTLVAIGLGPHFGHAQGATHNWAHAAARVVFQLGVDTFTKQEVNRVIIENGRAIGVELVDGTQVEATKLVVSDLDPHNLCFRLIGTEYCDPRLLRKVQSLERDRTCITWYHWATHELPQYTASSENPDINRVAGWLYLADKVDPYALTREHGWKDIGRMPAEPQMIVWQLSELDKTRAPEGKHLVASEYFVSPANWMTEKEWSKWKQDHAKDEIAWWQQFAPNMTWDNVIGVHTITPFDVCHLDNMAPQGNWAVIDNVPGQMGRCRPVPELANYKTPVQNLYATGSAWFPGGGGWCGNSYNCYKVIAADFGLRKPWEEKGRPY